MKRILKTMIISGILTLSLSFSCFAGNWQNDGFGWMWQNDDGSYPRSEWQWIDGDKDGIAECYYFDDSGYLIVNASVPDGNTVDANGAWIVDGIVQTKSVPIDIQETSQAVDNGGAVNFQNSVDTGSSKEASARVSSSGGSSDLNSTGTVWLPATGEKYHRIPNCGRMNPNKARAVTYEEALKRGYDACDKCF